MTYIAIERFGAGMDPLAIFETYRTIRQGPDETVLAFNQRFQNAWTSLPACYEMPEKVAIWDYLIALRLDLAAFVRGKTYSTIAAAMSAALRYEVVVRSLTPTTSSNHVPTVQQSENPPASVSHSSSPLALEPVVLQLVSQPYTGQTSMDTTAFRTSSNFAPRPRGNNRTLVKKCYICSRPDHLRRHCPHNEEWEQFKARLKQQDIPNH